MRCRLQQLMIQTGKTTKELVRETGICKSTIEKYRLNKIRIIYFKTLDKLCKSLNCDSTDLFRP